MRSKSAYGHFHVLPLFLTNNKMPFSLNCCILNTYSRRRGGGGGGGTRPTEKMDLSFAFTRPFFISLSSFFLRLLRCFIPQIFGLARRLSHFWAIFRPSDYYERCQWTLRNIGHTFSINKKLKH
jgi:hypothetical protein